MNYRYILAGVFLLSISWTTLVGQGYVLNGSASFLGGECYQLTPDSPGQAGSFFSQNTIDLTQPFSLQASFFFGCKDGNGADGIVFILATSNTALGNGGGGLGYEGITPSIAVETDDYFNSNYADPASDHMAVISMGSLDHSAPTNLVAPINITNIEDCMDHCFAVSWDPVSQRLEMSVDDNSISYQGDIVASIFSGNPLVYYGFSSGTGSLSNLHRVCFGTPEVDEMPDEMLCNGEGVQLQADENGIAWTWAPDPTLSSLTVSDPIASPTVTTTYTTIIEYSCGFFGYDTVEVQVLPLPTAIASNDGPICIGDALSLMASGGTSYQWSGPQGYTSSSQNPVINNVTIGMAGIYTVTITDAAGCTDKATTIVDVDPGPDITIDPAPNPMCENLDPFQLTADPPGGTWSGGEVQADGLFDPGYAGEGLHTITYTATNANGCSNTEQIDIEVVLIPEVLIEPPGTLCENANAIQLTASPPGGIWEGEISVGGVFDPAVAGDGPHLIIYTVEDGNGCINSAEIIIEVVPGLIADIEPTGPFCSSDSMITLIAIPPGGQWGGVANIDGEIFPIDLGPGFHEVTYTLNDQNGCYFGDQFLEILSTPEVVIDPINPLCLDASVQTMTANPPGGIWSGAANSAGQVDPALLGTGIHEVIYTQSFAGGCTDADTLDIEVLPAAPIIDNLITSCDPTSTSYTVTFSVTGGDPATYVIEGTVSGTLIPGNPAIFISEPLLSGTPFIFWVNDADNCDPDTVSGTKLCNCLTNAGTMDVNLVSVCEGDTITVIPPAGVVLDPDDSLVYVLHLGFPDSIILVSDTNVFAYNPVLHTGVTYFISTVAGNGSTGIGVDLLDPCLSVSFGTPVMWVAPPSGFLSASAQICDGDSTTLNFTLSGSGPFDIEYTDGIDTISISNIASGHSVVVQPIVNTTYTLIEVEDKSPPGCISYPGTSITIVVEPVYITQQSIPICAGDSILLGGSFQTVAGIYYDSLSSVSGCDSVIETSLTVLMLDTTYINDTSCDPAQTGVYTDVFTNYNGCDSTTITTVTWVLADTTLLQSITCDELDAGIFTDYYIGQSGCDSVVIETITFVPPDSTWISGTTCDPSVAGQFIEVQMNTSGCDSFIIETIMLIPTDTTIRTGETCNPGEAGVFMQMLTNTGGCDSLVIETIELLPSDTIVFQELTCLPQEVGTVQQVLTNIYGCDSLLLTVTSLAPEDSCLIPEIHREIFVPNIFSPNGDGINDFFFLSSHPEAVERIPVLRIYDRWGGLVYEKVDAIPNVPSDGWDGRVKEELTNPGVFVCVAEVVYLDGKTETLYGDVTLMR
jgi:gliding motility-associated-like protein